MNRFVNLNLLLSSAATLTFAQQCYYPNGAVPTDYNYKPCTGSQYSSCCIPSAGDICLSNGLCWWPSGPFPYRAACTDKQWISDACPRFCMGVNPTTWERLYICGGNMYCCGAGCCSAGGNTFFIAPGTVVNSFGVTGYAIPAELTAALSTSPAATATSSASPTSSPSSGSTSTKNVAIGVGVGVGAGLLVLITVAFFCFRYFRNKSPSPPVVQQQQYQQPQAQGAYPPPFEPPYSPQHYNQQRQVPVEGVWPAQAPSYDYGPQNMGQKPGMVEQVQATELDGTSDRK